MSDTLYYILGALALPVGALIVTRFVTWSFGRELDRKEREWRKARG